MNITPEQIIIDSPPGKALCARIDNQTAILIKEDERHLINLPSSSLLITPKSGILTYDNVPVAVTLFMTGLDDDMVFELWFNYQDNREKEYLEDLAKQDKLTLIFYAGKTKRRIMKLDNNLKNTFKQHIEKLKEYPAWSKEQFDKAKEKVLHDYLTTDDLWEKL